MNRKGFRFVLVFATVLCVIGLLSCARDQKLVSITVMPNNVTFGGPGLNVQYTAIGNYIHPAETKDITTKVIWASDATQVISFNTPAQPGLATSQLGCGTGIDISATVFSNPSNPSRGSVTFGTATANVTCMTGSGGSGPLLAVGISSGGTGTITSSPAGISCPSTCSANFPSGTAITLTATPTGTSTSVTWNSGCDMTSGNVCTINSLTADLLVTATFH